MVALTLRLLRAFASLGVRLPFWVRKMRVEPRVNWGALDKQAALN